MIQSIWQEDLRLCTAYYLNTGAEQRVQRNIHRGSLRKDHTIVLDVRGELPHNRDRYPLHKSNQVSNTNLTCDRP